MSIKEKITIALTVLVTGILLYYAFSGISSQSAKEWFAKPISSLNAGDLLLIVVVGAFMSRK